MSTKPKPRPPSTNLTVLGYRVTAEPPYQWIVEQKGKKDPSFYPTIEGVFSHIFEHRMRDEKVDSIEELIKLVQDTRRELTEYFSTEIPPVLGEKINAQMALLSEATKTYRELKLKIKGKGHDDE